MSGPALEPTGGTEGDDEHSSSGDIGVPRHIPRGVQGKHSRIHWSPSIHIHSLGVQGKHSRRPRSPSIHIHSWGVQGKHSRRPRSPSKHIHSWGVQGKHSWIHWSPSIHIHSWGVQGKHSAGDLGVPRHIPREVQGKHSRRPRSPSKHILSLGVQGIHPRRPWSPYTYPFFRSSRYTLQDILESLSISLLWEFKIYTPGHLGVPLHILSLGVQDIHSRTPWSSSPYPFLVKFNVYIPGHLGVHIHILSW